MRRYGRLIVAALAVSSAVAFAQAPPPPPDAAAPAAPAAAGGRGGRGGRGGGRGAVGASGASGAVAGGGRAARGGFTQFTRELAPAEVLTRGKAVFDTNCSSCHATDLRGVPPQGHSLLHSIIALDDKHGELIGAELAKHAAPITLAGGVIPWQFRNTFTAYWPPEAARAACRIRRMDPA